MLQITLPAIEMWDESKEEFVYVKEQTLQLEHSLVSLSKWESKWCKPFLTLENKTYEESLDYIKCMTLTQNVKDDTYYRISQAHMKQIEEYIAAPMTATTFSEKSKSKTSSEFTTSELIYYWMVALNIPFECQKWHLNRLITLIKVCNIKSQPPKKMGRKETLSRNAALNKARKQRLNTRG